MRTLVVISPHSLGHVRISLLTFSRPSNPPVLAPSNPSYLAASCTGPKSSDLSIPFHLGRSVLFGISTSTNKNCIPLIFAVIQTSHALSYIINLSTLSFSALICPMSSLCSFVVMLALITALLTPQALPKAVLLGTYT